MSRSEIVPTNSLTSNFPYDQECISLGSSGRMHQVPRTPPAGSAARPWSRSEAEDKRNRGSQAPVSSLQLLCIPSPSMAAEHDAVWHPLRVILHAYLATDAKAVESLKHTLAVLSKEALAPSSHLQKWSARLSALMHASEPSARWAGLCLALKTAQLSKSVMIESAQAWVTVALPLLSVRLRP
jgi:hypothetical protein